MSSKGSRPARELVMLRKQLAEAEEVIRFYANHDCVYMYPDDWDYFEMGGHPEMSDYERVDVGDTARAYLEKHKEIEWDE